MAEIIKMIIPLLCILITLYGVFKKNRVFFNSGYFIFGILIAFDQLNFFFENSNSNHIAIGTVFMLQVILSFPNKLNYDGSKIAKSASTKINLSLVSINLFGAYLATRVDYVPDEAMYGHLLFAILPIIAIYLVLTNKIELVKAE
tara:strand:+ start:325 stop:759 length:435 start_codon:yes stop_codon:yes gene_type:complete